MDVEANDLDPPRGHELLADGLHRGDRHTKLVGLESRRNVRMTLGVDVRIYPQGDAGADLAGDGEPIDPFDLTGGLGVDRHDAEIDGLGQLGRTLSHPGEDDLGRDEAGAERYVDLAAGVGVRTGAERAQQACDGERRVRLQRVVQRGRVGRERVGDRSVTFGDDRGAVDVERGAFSRSDVAQRDSVAPERAPLSMKAGLCHDEPDNLIARDIFASVFPPDFSQMTHVR